MTQRTYAMLLIGSALTVTPLAAMAEASFSYSSAQTTVTISNPDCTGPFTITETGVLSCPTGSGGGGDPTPNPVGNCTARIGGVTTNTTTVTEGATSKSLSVTCAYATSYAWFKDDNSIAGASATLTTPASLAVGQHVYKVVATNAADSTGKEATFTVTVNAAPPPDPNACNSTIRPTTNFDGTFDQGGQSFSLTLALNQTAALEFTNDKYQEGQIFIFTKSAAASTWISECPGVAPATTGCKTGYYSNGTDTVMGGMMPACNLGRDTTKKWYYNIKNLGTIGTNSISLKNSVLK